MWSNKIAVYSLSLFLISLFLLLATSSLALVTSDQSQSQSLELKIKLGKGWNMVSFPFSDADIFFNESDCYFLFNFAGKLKDLTKKAFRERYYLYNLKQMKDKLGGIPLNIYSYEECILKVKGSKQLTTKELNGKDFMSLKRGTNHIPIPYGGIKLTQIEGCEIESVRYYNSSEQVYKWYKWVPSGFNKAKFFKSNDTKTWIEISTSDNYYLPHGISILIDVKEDCKLMFSEESAQTVETTTTTTQQTTSQLKVEEIKCPEKNEWNWCPGGLRHFKDMENKKIIIHGCNATQLGSKFGDIYLSQFYFNVSAPDNKRCKLEWIVNATPKGIDRTDIGIYANWGARCPTFISDDKRAFGDDIVDNVVRVAKLINETFSGISYVAVSVFSNRTVREDTIFNVSVSITDC